MLGCGHAIKGIVVTLLIANDKACSQLPMKIIGFNSIDEVIERWEELNTYMAIHRKYILQFFIVWIKCLKNIQLADSYTETSRIKIAVDDIPLSYKPSLSASNILFASFVTAELFFFTSEKILEDAI